MVDDPATARRMGTELGGDNGTIRPERIVIANTAEGPYRRFIGRTIADVADELGIDAHSAVVETLRGQRGHVGVIHHSMSDEDVRLVARRPDVAVASDGAALGCPGPGKVHPRSLGTFTRVLGRFVREEGLLDLPTAVAKMTSIPATRLGWIDRGILRPGAIADLVVFDPTAVIDHATFLDPWRVSTGVLHTFIAGTAVLEDTRPTGVGAGRVIRGHG